MLSYSEMQKSASAGMAEARGCLRGEDYRLPWQVYELLLLVIVGGG